MKYYVEDEMKDIREAFEKEVLKWPEVTTKKMFGCPCYKANEKLFTFIVTKGIVFTKLQEDEREDLTKQYKVKPFQAGTRTMKGWAQIEINNKNELEKVIPFLKKSYENAIKA